MQTDDRYDVVQDGVGYFVVDLTIEDDGETPSNVAGFWTRKEAEERAAQMNAHEAGDDCGVEKCPVCCAHDERDHGICLDCEHEADPGEAIDRAEYQRGDR